MEKWNYAEMQNKENFFGTQKDWNQTLVTMINQVSDKNYPTTILVPKKFQSLIESLEFYKLGKIGNKYNVNFTESTNDIIELDGKKLLIENYNVNRGI